MPSSEPPPFRLVSTGDPPEYVDASAEPVDEETMRARRDAAGGGGKHLFVVALFFHVADPETDLDAMTLGADNVVGANPAFCFWCKAPYIGRQMQFTVCPGEPRRVEI